MSSGSSFVPVIQRTTPVPASIPRKRWAGRAVSPQPVTTALAITRSSKTTGMLVRPPYVERKPNSSWSDRRHFVRPVSASIAENTPHTPCAKIVFVAGSATTADQPTRSDGTSER